MKKAALLLALVACVGATAGCSALQGLLGGGKESAEKAPETVADTYAAIQTLLASNATNMETLTEMTVERLELGGGNTTEHTITTKISGSDYYFKEISESDSAYDDSTNVEYYYVGGTAYVNDGTEKTQEAMTEQEFQNFANVSSPIFALPTLAEGKLNNVAFKQEKSGSSFTIEFGYGELNGAPFEKYKNYNELKMTVYVTDSKEFSSVKFSCNETNQIFYTMTISVTNMGTTSVSAPSDASSYLSK